MTVDQQQLFFDNFSKSGGTVCRNEPLSKHTTWGVGGPADLYFEPENLVQLINGLQLVSAAGISCLIIGAGSNLLVQDGGFRGLVIQTRKLQQVELAASGRLKASCGVWLPDLARKTVSAGWAGLECLAGIPGTLGGAVVMNAAAHGQSVSDHLESIRLFASGEVVVWSREQLACGYRSSAVRDGQVVLEVDFQLSPGHADDLQQRLDACRKERRDAQNVGGPNAGSVFKNPPGMQAWRLIDAAGMRGEKIGNAMVSQVHTNFIVNLGGASAADMMTLIHRIEDRVRTCCHVELEREIRIVGVPAG
jgi:UDP-N-acetylmuramate dehydrogenase